MTRKSTLRRALGRTTATFLTAAMIIGTGLFAALGATAEKAGTGLLLAMTFSGLVALATGLSAASVGIHFPEEGGGFTWSRQVRLPHAGVCRRLRLLGQGHRVHRSHRPRLRDVHGADGRRATVLWDARRREHRCPSGYCRELARHRTERQGVDRHAFRRTRAARCVRRLRD